MFLLAPYAKYYVTHNPENWNKCIKYWNGKDNVLEASVITYLVREFDFTDQGAETCASVFIANAKGIGCIDSNNAFHIDADVVLSPPEQKQKKTADQKTAGDKNQAAKRKSTDNVKHAQSFPINGKPVAGIKTVPVWIRSKELLVPILEDMTSEDWDAFIKQIQYKKSN
jgi:hypothetical protein